ncbi:HK97 family phage prohead protease [Parvularcula sp. IMCC14364]|uniref:HK97 family phage prohead protease n=1 Tax=Parvularcula sp. IMCC14364 TaxID=3067902 RepID=UPI00274114B2|nr:HK97 family phage prohead protease [Parvularcula sp. IMCC14364]
MAALLHRHFVEVRNEGGRKLAGMAAVYGVETDIGAFKERIRPGAFERTLSSDADVLAFADHDPSKLLGRRSTGTLRLSDTDDGLLFELDVPDTATGRDVLALADRGDLGGMSFGFLVRDGGEMRDGDVRVLTDIDLREISVVSAWPAYSGTSVEARSKQVKSPSFWRWR